MLDISKALEEYNDIIEYALGYHIPFDTTNQEN